MSIKTTEADLAFAIEALRMRTNSIVRSLEGQIHEMRLEEMKQQAAEGEYVRSLEELVRELSKRPAKRPVKRKTTRTTVKRKTVRRTKGA
jgi:hypothetical protein